MREKNIFITRIILIFILFIFSKILFSQNYIVSGRVIDSQTKEPLAFVNVLVNSKNYHVLQTNIDGYFRIELSLKTDSLLFSYVGYENYTLKNSNFKKNCLIELHRKEFQLKEVVVFPGENPAHRIINKVIENRDKNNPEKTRSFTYSSYNKMLVKAYRDTIKKNILPVEKPSPANSDTSKKVSLFKDQYYFMMESATERKFMYPDRNNEKIVATKTSGFKDPMFSTLFSQMQSFSFYNEFIQIIFCPKNYLNPISKGSTNKYFFLMEDTLYDGKDSIYIISFKPHKNKNFDGLKAIVR